MTSKKEKLSGNEPSVVYLARKEREMKIVFETYSDLVKDGLTFADYQEILRIEPLLKKGNVKTIYGNVAAWYKKIGRNVVPSGIGFVIRRR